MTRTIKLVCLRDACPHPEANTTCSVCGRRPTFDEDGHWSVQPARPSRWERFDDPDRPAVPSPSWLGRQLDRMLRVRIIAANMRQWARQ
jgi:hypothetical protein